MKIMKIIFIDAKFLIHDFNLEIGDKKNTMVEWLSR